VCADSVDPLYSVDTKPPMKLINAWLAGVPAVLGVESAFRAIREHELDYLEVRSPDELEGALFRLRNDPELYRAMVAHGRARAAGFTTERGREVWKQVLTEDLRERHDAWRRQGHMRRLGVGVVNTLRYFSKADNVRSLLTIFR